MCLSHHPDLLPGCIQLLFVLGLGLLSPGNKVICLLGQHLLNLVGEAAGVENVHPHRFRRTFATNLVNRGMEIQEVGKLLGHANLNTTLTYVYTNDEKVRSSYMRYIA